jgi:hypothetical protein
VDEDKLREDIMAFDRYFEMLMSGEDADVETGEAVGDDGVVGGGQPGGGSKTNNNKLDGGGSKNKSNCCRDCCGRFRKTAHRVFTLVKTDVGLFVLLMVYLTLGAAILHATEIDAERQLRAELNATLRRVVDEILTVTSSHPADANLTEAVDYLVTEYASAKESLWPYTNSPGWSYTGAFYFCGTIFTTVGYGNVYPLTDTGRMITIVYAAFGIPLCLVVLANLGRTMTHAIKYLWSFIRRFYYTGHFQRRRYMIPLSRLRLSLCQRIRFHFRRNRTTWHRRARRTRRGRDDDDDDAAAESELERLRRLGEIVVPYEVDDNFNLPPIVALTIALLYMLLGARIYSSWENWTYPRAFYFTFISLSTIGLGDVVPEHPRYFLATGFYLLLGLALLAMVINVFMVAVHVTITKATDHVRLLVADAPQQVQGIVRRIHLHQEAAVPTGSSPPVPSTGSRTSYSQDQRRRSI